jgi:hypothetical protein
MRKFDVNYGQHRGSPTLLFRGLRVGRSSPLLFPVIVRGSCLRVNLDDKRSGVCSPKPLGSPGRPSSLRLQAAAGGSQGAGLSILAGIVPGGAPTSDDASLLHQVVPIRRGRRGQPGRFTSVAGKGSIKDLNPSSRWEEVDPVDAVDPAEG